jgi:hypothetical protein
MMDDPSSYESVKFDTLFKRLRNVPGEHEPDDSVELYYSYMDSTQMFSTHRNKDGASRFSYIAPDAKRAARYQQRVDQLNQYIDSHHLGRFQPAVRYMLAHQYRAKNMFGATITNVIFAELDTNVTHVTKIRESRTLKPWGE